MGRETLAKMERNLKTYMTDAKRNGEQWLNYLSLSWRIKEKALDILEIYLNIDEVFITAADWSVICLFTFDRKATTELLAIYGKNAATISRKSQIRRKSVNKAALV